MAHWIIEDQGFVGTYYTCSECGEYFWDIFELPDISECPKCHAKMDKDNEYIEVQFNRGHRVEIHPVDDHECTEGGIV